MKVLGIETSCDETAAAVVEDGRLMLSNEVASSLPEQIKYGGVVPEIAARSHIEVIEPVVAQALKTAGCSWSDIDAIAVTYGPGLGGSLLIGVITARTLAIVKQKPLLGINHVWAHTYANYITATPLPGYQLAASPPNFPLLSLIVSGGHTQLVLALDHSSYRLLGRTLDDAVGEAFDKVAKIIGLPYPGGPSISEAAKTGNPGAFAFPVAATPKYDFSFSGVKTAVLRRAQRLVGEDFSFPSYRLPERLKKAQSNDLAATFQAVAVRTLVDKLVAACREYQPASVAIAGGVAANQELRHRVAESGIGPVWYPDIKLCTDNGAMVATRGYFQHFADKSPADPYTLTIDPSLKM